MWLAKNKLMYKIRQIRETIQKEKIYAWMLIFILWFNALNLISDNLSSQKFIKGDGKLKLEKVSYTYQPIPDIKPEEFKSILDKNATLANLLLFMAGLIALFVAIGLILDLKFIFLKLQGKNILFSSEEPAKVKWQVADIIKVIILFLFFAYGITLIESIIFSLIHKEINDTLFMVINASLMDILAIVFILYFIIKKYKQGLSSIGLKLTNFLNNFFLGLYSYITIFPVIIIVLFIIMWFSNLVNYQPPIQPIFELFFQEKQTPLVMYLTVFVTFIGPIAEEIFFRGFAYRALRQRIGVFKAITVTSLVFAALHTNLAGFFPILILGILLAYLVQKTNSIIPSITVHIIHNSTILSFLLLTKKIMEAVK